MNQEDVAMLKEYCERLYAMAVDTGETWDLSENDQAACNAGGNAITALLNNVKHDGRCESELTSHGYTPCRCHERYSRVNDGSVMVRVDPVFAEAMRSADGLIGPFSSIRLIEGEGEPRLELSSRHKPAPDTIDWWRSVAQELSIEIHRLKIAQEATPPDLVRIGQSPA